MQAPALTQRIRAHSLQAIAVCLVAVLGPGPSPGFAAKPLPVCVPDEAQLRRSNMGNRLVNEPAGVRRSASPDTVLGFRCGMGELCVKEYLKASAKE
jgi:hypothetical protein